jgi:ABC-type transporter MlaC component
MVKVLDDPALKADSRAQDRRAAIRKEAQVVFDFGETAKRALGRHWQGLSEKDRQEFTANSFVGTGDAFAARCRECRESRRW